MILKKLVLSAMFLSLAIENNTVIATSVYGGLAHAKAEIVHLYAIVTVGSALDGSH